ncbi:hypothetical protein ACFVQ4_14420 [Streptomyces laurentii]|uniref:hypothetical protein n=1 Tax=Streptomyces laurentii TaxID=39478 RepID=UPI0036A81468
MASDVWRANSGRLFLADGQQAWFGWNWPNAQSSGFWVRPSVNQDPFSDQTAWLYYESEVIYWDNGQGIPQQYFLNLRSVHNSEFIASLITVT